MKRIFIIGGYGVFGSSITKALSRDDDIKLIIGGRDEEKAKTLAKLVRETRQRKLDFVDLDFYENLPEVLDQVEPDIVIHTTGPFQGQDYIVAQACLDRGCHYIDLADGREFVAGISKFDKDAKKKGVAIISGASSVPCLSYAVVEHYLPEFSKLEEIDYGITLAQQANRGLATISGALSYTGQPFQTLAEGQDTTVYGMQDLRFLEYPGLGRRGLGNSEVPDLSIFPERLPDLKDIRFYAGMEVKPLQTLLWMLSWLPRWGAVKNLQPWAPKMLVIAKLFNTFGSGDSGFHMFLKGTGKDGAPLERKFYLIARNGEGVNIPACPPTLLARRLAHGKLDYTGATPCVGLVSLKEIMASLDRFDIEALEDDGEGNFRPVSWPGAE